ncbi:hypothetical protein Acr_05g0009380 [Actinidia rufa]|uniref:RNase H type-1 domain-containing protein n=1 Tax=Actinidia rufa TaxID=165716 RepID=A0A7J0EMT8_9ERIC|nr:hypothetical protein Acr_05g0009380 [Actinidia rufa]
MAIKAQALIDFIVELTYNIAPNPETEIPEVQEDEESDTTRWKLFMDGSYNLHGCGAGLVLQSPSREQMEYAIHIGFKATNNEEEYETFLTELRVTTELEVESLNAYSDSQLIMNQVQGDYLAKDLCMLAYLDEVKAMMMKIKDFKIRQIPKEENNHQKKIAPPPTKGSMTPWRSFFATTGLSMAEASSPKTTPGLIEVPSPRATKVGASQVASRPDVALDFAGALVACPFFLSFGGGIDPFILASAACFPFLEREISGISS